MTDRRVIGDERFGRVLDTLKDAPELTVQLRDRGAPDRETLAWAVRARGALDAPIPLYIHRRFDLSLAAGAQGVHLPSDGLPANRVRAITPRGFRIGVSTHSAREAADAIEEGADLVVVGPIFATPSKAGMGEPLGPQALSGLPRSDEHGREVFAIGGISESNLAQLARWRDRITGIAGIRLFQESADPGAVARRIAAQ